jgi:hypothetical protein
MSLKINSLLMPEAPVKLLVSSQEEEVSLRSGLKCHYKVFTKYKPVPLKLKVLTKNGMNHTFIYVSQVLPRPSKDHCDNSFLVKAKKSLFVLYGSQSKSKIFTEEAVYFTIECRKESDLILMIGFRNELLSLNAEKECVNAIKENRTRFSFSEEDLKKLLLLTSTSKATSRHFKNKSRINIMTRREKRNHREQVVKARNENEEKEVARKFLLSNKNIINQWHDAIIERKKIEKQVFTKSVFLWVSIIHLQQIAKYSYEGIYILERNKKRIALRFYSAAKIRMAIQRTVFNFSRKFNERFNHKLST